MQQDPSTYTHTARVKPLRIWAVVLSRKGSQRLANKAMLPLGSKPLGGWYLEALSRAQHLEKRFLFSDDDALNTYCTEAFEGQILKPPFTRPAEISHAQAGSFETLRWFIEQWPEAERPDALLLGQLTTPFTQANDIDAALEIFTQQYTTEKNHCVVSVTQPLKPARWLMAINPQGILEPLPQSEARIVYPNGALYIIPTVQLTQQRATLLSDFKKIFPYEMPWKHSIDIDTLEDLAMAESLLPYQPQQTTQGTQKHTATALQGTSFTHVI